MIAFKRFCQLVRGGLLDPSRTWEEYFREERGAWQTAAELTIPLVLLTALIVPALSSLFGVPQVLGSDTFDMRGFLSGIAGTATAMVAMGALAALTARWFADRATFDRGFAAVSLTSIPAFAADVVGTVPVIGWVIEITGSLVSVVFLYRVMPLALGLPRNRRIPHFLLLLVSMVLIGVVLRYVFGGHPADSAPSL